MGSWYRDPRVTYLFRQNWRPEELVNAESMSCSRLNSRCRSQSYDDRVDPGFNGLQRPLPRCITQHASFDIESTRPSILAHLLRRVERGAPANAVCQYVAGRRQDLLARGGFTGAVGAMDKEVVVRHRRSPVFSGGIARFRSAPIAAQPSQAGHRPPGE